MEQKPFEEELEKELYKTKSSGRLGKIISTLGAKKQKAFKQEFWQEDPEEMTKNFPLKKFFWWSFLVFAVSLLVFAFVIYYRAIQISGINLGLAGRLEVNSLSPEIYMIQLKNNSKSTLEEASLNIELGDNAYFLDEPDSKNKIISLGTLEQNKEQQIPLNLFFAGKINQVTEVKITLNYLSPKKNQQFSIERKISVNIKKAVFDFQTYAPKQVFVGEPFQISFKLSNITNQPFELKVKITNPGNFESISYSPPYEEFMVWDFGNFEPNSLSEIIIVGKFTKNPLNPIFTVLPIVNFQGKEFIFNEIPVAVKAINSPVVLEIKSYPDENITGLQNNITYTVNWDNKSSISLNDARLKVVFEGPFDSEKIRTDGYYSAFENALIWDARNNQKLYKISPGDSGTISFGIETLKDYPIQNINSKNFILRVKATLETSSIPPEIQILSPKLSVETENVKILPGEISLSSQLNYNDSIIKNYGKFPFSPGSKTTATAHLYINTTAEDFQNVLIKTRIPIGVKLTGVWGGNFEPENLTYNQATGDFFYNIKDISANLGNVYEPLDIAFQIEITPPIGDPKDFSVLNTVELSAQGKHSQKSFTSETRPIKLSDIK